MLKFLEDNIRESLDDPGFGNDFLATTPKAWYMKELISWTSSELVVAHLQKTVKRMRKCPQTLVENICKWYIW